MTGEMVDKAIAVDTAGNSATGLASLPAWYPVWARRLAELYFSGTTSMFVLHGNTFDFARLGGGEARSYGALAEFLAGQVFGKWDLVLHYDLARGLRCLAGSSEDRLRAMVELANKRVGDLTQMPKSPTDLLLVLDRFLQKNVLAEPAKRLSVALIIDHASYIVPRGDRLSVQDQKHVVTLLNWASSPYIKRLNVAVALIDMRLSDVSERLAGNPHVAAIEVPLPDEAERSDFLSATSGGTDIAKVSDYSLGEIAKLTAGISLTDVNVMLQSALESGRRLDRELFRELKKRLIERQAQGMLEFVEPKWDLDMVVGHDAAKQRLKDDAELLKRGALDNVPMGYLVCGPVGTGKSFLAQCTSGAIGIPCVTLKNFRSKFVGETEGNLERVLSVLRSMGPVGVIVDEADTMLGDRDQGGDSGVGSRVFGMIANQMGDTRYRGRIVWFLLTARPDLLPIDLKRQGRAEVHIPLFYPTDDAELRHMFMVLAKKAKAILKEESLPTEFPHKGNLSGADIEGILGRAARKALLSGTGEISAATLGETLAGFMPSTQSLERELQEVAAIIECTDLEFLPEAKREKMKQLGGREKLQERLTALKQIVEGS